MGYIKEKIERKEERLERCMKYITDHYRRYRTGLTVREILYHFRNEVTSTNTVHKWVLELEKTGRVQRTQGRAGSIIPAYDPIVAENAELKRKLAELEA